MKEWKVGTVTMTRQLEGKNHSFIGAKFNVEAKVCTELVFSKNCSIELVQLKLLVDCHHVPRV
jgi:hypothetical protein